MKLDTCEKKRCYLHGYFQACVDLLSKELNREPEFIKEEFLKMLQEDEKNKKRCLR